jgi:hypothetical protein
VNADGYVQACPFCQSTSFHALDENLSQHITTMRTGACARLQYPSDRVTQLINGTWRQLLPEEQERNATVTP